METLLLFLYTINKKNLYNKIMKSVSKEVKKTLNEKAIKLDVRKDVRYNCRDKMHKAECTRNFY